MTDEQIKSILDIIVFAGKKNQNEIKLLVEKANSIIKETEEEIKKDLENKLK